MAKSQCKRTCGKMALYQPACATRPGRSWLDGHLERALVSACHQAHRPHSHTHFLDLTASICIIKGPASFLGTTRSVPPANLFCMSVHTIVLVLLITQQLVAKWIDWWALSHVTLWGLGGRLLKGCVCSMSSNSGLWTPLSIIYSPFTSVASSTTFSGKWPGDWRDQVKKPFG